MTHPQSAPTGEQELIALADSIVRSLAGTNFDGSPNTGLVSAMSLPTARQKILAALRAGPACGDCQGSGVNNYHQTWPGTAPCRYCEGTGRAAASPRLAGREEIHNAIEFGIWFVSGPSNDAEEDHLNKIIKEACADYDRQKPAPSESVGWQPIESAKKNRTPILAKFYDDIYPRLRPERDDLERWNGLQVVLRHPGLAEDGFDIGWGVAAPVGCGGFPDEWIEGWKPLDAPPTSHASQDRGSAE